MSKDTCQNAIVEVSNKFTKSLRSLYEYYMSKDKSQSVSPSSSKVYKEFTLQTNKVCTTRG